MENYFVKARAKTRLTTQDVIKELFVDFMEIHGDRINYDDQAIICGFATFGNHKVMVIGHNKGHDFQENQVSNYGMPSPQGFRKAIRALDLAERFNLPVITFIDTPGAYPGKLAEENGQSSAISHALLKMLEVNTKVLTIVLSEASSGGALGIALGNEVYMLEHAVYSILSPEGMHSILHHDNISFAEILELTKARATDLKAYNLIDGIIKEDEPLLNMQVVIKNFLAKKIPNPSGLRELKYRGLKNEWL